MEKPMAEYIVSRKDWTFASVEMGINMLNNPLNDAAYEQRIKEFIEILAADSRPVFVTDIFTHNGEKQERTELFKMCIRDRLYGKPASLSAGNKHDRGEIFFHPGG